MIFLHPNNVFNWFWRFVQTLFRKNCSNIYPKKSHQFHLDHVQELIPSDYFQELWISPVVSCPQQFWLFGFLAVEIWSEINPGVLPRNCFSDNSSRIHPTISRNFFLISEFFQKRLRSILEMLPEFLQECLQSFSRNTSGVPPKIASGFLQEFIWSFSRILYRAPPGIP